MVVFKRTYNRKPATAAFIATVVLIVSFTTLSCNSVSSVQSDNAKKDTLLFAAPDTANIPHDEFGEMVRYGRELIVNTAYYIGPNGTVGKHLGNKMNCGNCHLDAGTRPYGLNFFSSHGRYPQYRGRENTVLTLADRVNNCIERPHNGVPLPLNSKEMIAFTSYMKWLASNVPVGTHVNGDDGVSLQYPSRAADINKGAAVYETHCKSCHGGNGEGIWNADTTTYTYPPLWGKYAYQTGSSMHRVLKAARFIKANMPHNQAFWNKPMLTDEEAIDVAAFINNDAAHNRPTKKDVKSADYPVYNVKPVDYDLGPFNDTFAESQHKFGPFQPIIDYHKSHKLPVVF